MKKIKNILVTGASRGIGAACAKELACEGVRIAVHYRSREDEASKVVDAIREKGADAELLAFDIADRAGTKEKLESFIAEHGAFHSVVCNAGIAMDNAFPALDGDAWDKVVHTNLDAFYNVLHPLIMPMIKLRSGGRIVTMSSVSGLVGNRGQTNYSAAKAGIIGATKSLAIELAKRKITVNCVAPGVIETEMTDDIYREEAMKMIPMQRFGQAEEVAKAVKFLLSDDAGYITRQVLSVNGGFV